MHSILTEIPDIRVFGFSLRDYLGEANANGGTATPKRPETKRWSLFDEYARSQNGAGVGSGAGPVNESTRDGGWQLLERRIETKLALADDHYQRFVQKHIDPLLGRSRHAELQSMLANETAVLQPAERYANRRLGLGLTALGLSILGVFVFTPLIPLAILVGLAASSAKYPLAYRQWKETKRVGAIHLICVYSLYLWLGGYATVGALGAVLYGLMLKARAVGEDQSRTNLISMFQLEPDKVWVRSDGNEIEIPFKQVLIGDILVLRAGQIVPVDGTIVAGVATVDQHMLTGEAQPVERKPGDGLLAATLIVSGQVDVAVEKTSSETTAGKIAEVLNRTMNNAKPASISAVEAADKLALPTLALSVIGWPFVGTAGAVSLMGANTTTASYLSGSLAMLNFVNIAARNGVLVKDAQALEQLSIVDTILFDKTGTLTLERPHVVAIHALNNADPKRIIMLAAAAEARQTHPIALAILDEAKELNLRLPAIDDAHYEVGYGIKVRLVESPVLGDSASKLVRVGSGRFMEMEGIELPELVHARAAECQAEGHSLALVAVDREVIGCIELKPTVRPEAERIVQELHQRGLATYLVSGDQEAPTRKLAHDLGMTGYFANTLPEAKGALVAKLQGDGKHVCFVGDGINDAIAMRQAKVSISLLGATTIATDTARIVLMDGNLEELVNLFQIGDEFARGLKHNIRFTSGVSILAVSGILLGGFTFAATEVLYSVALFGALGIAMKPLLARRQQDTNKRDNLKKKQSGAQL